MKRKIPDNAISIETTPKYLRIEDPFLDDSNYSDDEPEDGNRYLGLIFILIRQMKRVFYF